MVSSECPTLDLAHLSQQTFGDRALGRELLDLFDGQCARILPFLAGPASLRMKADAAHTLKGGARAIGAWRVAQAAERLERAFDSNKADGLTRLLDDLDKAVQTTRRAAGEIWSDV